MSAPDAAPRAGTRDSGQIEQGNSLILREPKPLKKWQRVLRALANGERITRFAAERIGCHCLNTTISQLGRRGWRVDRIQVVLPGRFGDIHCLEYFLDETEQARARSFLQRDLADER